MNKNKLKKIAAFGLVAILVVCNFSGCSVKDDYKTNNEVIHNLGTEVKTIDPALNTAVDGSTVIGNAFEGLYKLDENNQPVPATAESCDISEDGLVYTFHIRKDAAWSDGNDVTAQDFANAWIRALNPKTAAESAYQLYYIEGGEEFNTKDGTEENVGIKVIDDKTLEVTLSKPTAYFLELTTTAIYMPIRKDIIDEYENKWTKKADTYISNGPFKMIEYNMKDSYVFVPNEYYYDKDKVKIKKLTFKMVTDATSSYAALKNGELTSIDTVPISEIASGLEAGTVKIYPQIGTYFYVINVDKNSGYLDEEVKKALSNKLVRHALNLALDRRKLVDEVVKGSQTPAYSYVSQGIINEDGSEYSNKEYWNSEKYDVEGAKKLLKEAGYPNGEGLPTFELLYNSTENNKLIAEAIQQMWAEVGVKATLKNEEWAVFQDSRKNGNYEIARHGWTGDYADPMTFLDMWVTNGASNDAGFANSEYDSLIAKAKNETNVSLRSEYLRKAEDILMDEMPVLPMYYYTQVKGISLDVKDIKVSPLGAVYFDRAYIE